MPAPAAAVMLERLQKIISRAGVASRRRAEDLIVSGQVEVNGRVVTALGTKADPERDSIRVAGRRLRLPERRIVIALNKPDACVSALQDPQGRPTLRDSLTGVAGRVYPVGGLEYHSTGLVLLTSDGALASRLFRALGQGLPQTFHLKVKAPLKREEIETIERRIGPIRPTRTGPNPWYEVQLAGPRKDRLRRLLLEMGHPVEKVKRVAIGRIELADLEGGRWRALTEQELRRLEKDLERLPARLAAGTALRPPARPSVSRFRGKPSRATTRHDKRTSGKARAARPKKPRRGKPRPSRRKPA
jgi:23S rRNA pseudouridine2605 synthase